MHRQASCAAQQGQARQLSSGAIVAGACAAAIAVTLVAVVLSFQAAAPAGQLLARSQHQTIDNEAFCDLYQGQHLQMCSGYISAQAEDKFNAAIAWRQASRESYECSGIQVECLNEDLMHNNAAGSTCRPLPQGTECGFGKTCQSGYCRGSAAALLADGVSQVQPEAQPDSIEDVQEEQQQAAAGIDADIDASDSSEAAEPAVSRILAEKMKLDKPIAAWPTASATVNTNKLGLRVTDTFLATSHEYTRIQDYGDERMAHAWAEIFKMLSPAPVLRIGGASQDRMTAAPGDDVWLALKNLRKHTNCRYILGLPLFPKNSVQLSQQIIAASQKHLGDAIIGYELGNEPEFWPNGIGGYDKKFKWQKGFEAYAGWFHRVAMAINPCNSGKKMISGPGFGNVNTQPPKWTAAILYKGKDCYLWELNLHYYPYINNQTVTAQQLLSQQLQDFGVTKFGDNQRIAMKEKMGIRISETNSLYGGGRSNLSDTVVGTLWVADALFAFSAAGAKAFHLHWGRGGHPQHWWGQPNTGVQTNFHFDVRPGEPPVPWPSVHAPWYGYLFWTIAAAGDYGKHADANFVTAKIDSKGKCGANMKVWALKADNADLRVVLLNKDVGKHCNMKIIVEKQYCSKQATLTRLLPGDQGIKSKGGITFQGQTYDNAGYNGKIQGVRTAQQLVPKEYKGGWCGFEVPVPAASGAILISKIKK